MFILAFIANLLNTFIQRLVPVLDSDWSAAVFLLLFFIFLVI